MLHSIHSIRCIKYGIIIFYRPRYPVVSQRFFFLVRSVITFIQNVLVTTHTQGYNGYINLSFKLRICILYTILVSYQATILIFNIFLIITCVIIYYLFNLFECIPNASIFIRKINNWSQTTIYKIKFTYFIYI